MILNQSLSSEASLFESSLFKSSLFKSSLSLPPSEGSPPLKNNPLKLHQTTTMNARTNWVDNSDPNFAAAGSFSGRFFSSTGKRSLDEKMGRG